ncbi:hypothetical protein O181_126509 [Austropuccinia psidii MF-1]|uniref:Uncharacterized protein n=1 Tax=Austropuccinia psidii MF-1 TaxID=1389203 RepID=A0A9Q3KW69_9BASI|nr:hypothetical protein [Austropuccinia psidii MF-1]
MPVQNSPPAKDTRSQRHQAVLTPTEKAPLDCTPSVNQLSENLDRGPPMEGAASSRRGGVNSRRARSFSGLLGVYPSMSQGHRSRLGEAEDKEREEYVEEEECEETEVEAALAGTPEASESANLAHSNNPLVSQSEPNFLKMMKQITKFMGKLTQAVALRDNSKAPAFKIPSMKAPDSFDGTQAHKVRGFIHSCQFIFHNVSQPRVLALLLDGCGNPTWSQDGANWSCHVLYGQLAPLGVLWSLRHSPSQPSFMA